MRILKSSALSIRTRGGTLLLCLCIFLVCITAGIVSYADETAVPEEEEELTAEETESSSILIGTDDPSDDAIVHIGFIVIDNYNYIDVNGEWRGYDIELLLKLYQYGDMLIEGVPFESSANALDALRTGEVDALIDFNRTEERAAEFLLSANTVASDKLVVYARSDDDRFIYGDAERLGGIRIGTIEGSGVNELLPGECAKYGVSPELVPYASVDEINAALDKGEIDAACSGSNAAPKEYTAIFSFMSDSAYILLQKDNTELCNRLDNMVSQLLSDEPFYLYNLSSKYMMQSFAGEIEFTEDEAAYIQQAGVIRVAVPNNDEPYSYMKSGELTGVIPEYYSVLSDKTGLTFECVGYDSYSETILAVQQGEADVLGMFYGDIITANYIGMSISSEYSSYDCIMISKTGSEEKVGKVAATDRTQAIMRVQLAQQGVDAEIVAYRSLNDCYYALSDGEVDAMVCSMNSAGWIINQHSRANLSILTMPGIQLEMAACMPENNTLYDILNKAIEASNVDMQRILAECSVTDQSNVRTMIENIPPMVILIVSGVIIIFLIALIYTLTRLMKRNQERALVAQMDAETKQREAEVKAVRELNEKRSAFFSNISHDMRTPLNAIIGFSDIAGRSDDIGEVHEYLDKINTSGGILLNLINDTLTVSKMNNGKLELDPKPTDTKHMIDEICVPIRANAERKRITFTEELPAESRTIMCDALNTQKVILNILSNAIKYTPEEGEVKFRVVLSDIHNAESSDGASDGSDRCNMHVEVSDTGVGMDSEFLPHIFEPFAQENSKFGVATGVGLGLAIAKELVDTMGGTIDVSSVKNKGTTFVIDIPFEELRDTVVDTDADKKGSEIDLTGRWILLFEDNEMNAEIAGTILEQYGAEVTVAENGKVGVDIFSESEEGAYSLILMDLRMPVMDGYEATRAIRAMGSEGIRQDAESVPIVAMSADAFAEDVDKCRQAGMDGHIPKPIDMDKLMSVLRSLK